MVQTGRDSRQAAVAQAETIIDNGVRGFMQWMDQRTRVPIIQELQQQAGFWREAELTRARKLLAKGASPEEALQALAKGLTQKMLHGAMTELQSGDPDQASASQQAIERLFLRGADRQR